MAAIFGDGRTPGQVQHRASDPAGNLFRTADGSDRRYGRGGRLERAGGTQYRYDAEGNLIEKLLADGARWQYRWNHAGRLVGVVRPDGREATYGYDALGRRIRKEFDGTVTEFVWDGDDLVHERVIKDGEVAPIVTWLFEPGMFAPLAKLEGQKRFGVVTDHLGTPAVLMSEAGRVAWKAQLDVYGVPHETRGEVAEAERTENPWRYPGQYEDAETGLYYNRFRYYDPESGRYVSEDPIGLEGGFGQFAYCVDPTRQRDPLGLSCDPGLDDFVEKLKKRGVKVKGTNVNIAGEGRILGEVDVVTDNALIQFKNGPSSASAVVRQVRQKTEPFVDLPVVAFINDTTKAGARTVKGAQDKILVTNDFDELVDLIN